MRIISNLMKIKFQRQEKLYIVASDDVDYYISYIKNRQSTNFGRGVDCLYKRILRNGICH